MSDKILNEDVEEVVPDICDCDECEECIKAKGECTCGDCEVCLKEDEETEELTEDLYDDVEPEDLV